MVTKDVSVPGTPFGIERIWIEDGRLRYTRQGDSIVEAGPNRAGLKALIDALNVILKAWK